jgi:hypothetical protein
MQLHPLIKICQHIIIYVSFFVLSTSAAFKKDPALGDRYKQKLESLHAKSADRDHKIDSNELLQCIKGIVEHTEALSLSEFKEMYGLGMCGVWSSLPPQNPSRDDLITSINVNPVVEDLIKSLFKAAMITFAQEEPDNIKQNPEGLYFQIFETFADIYRYVHRNNEMYIAVKDLNLRDAEFKAMLTNPDEYFNSSNESINPRALANDITSCAYSTELGASSVTLDAPITFQSNNQTDYDLEDDNNSEENNTYEANIEQSEDILNREQLFQLPSTKAKSEQSKKEKQKVKSHAIQPKQPKLTQRQQLSEEPVAVEAVMQNQQARNMPMQHAIMPIIPAQLLISLT